ncbi:MAG: ABC transporter ATP-binding protein [Acidimicrobiales bacterium]
MNGSEVLVRCNRVARTFGQGRRALVAVHGVSLEMRGGQQVAVTGPSGSGKSTLLHLLAGLDDPTTGTVSWPALGSRDHLRPGPVAVVFQGPSLLPPLDVVENVALPLVLAGMGDGDAQVVARAALGRLGLEALALKLPEELSGGQAQRVAVARAVAGRPRLLLADEPTGQLDHANGAIVLDALVHTAQHLGAGLVLTTHDPLVAGRLPERWRMSDGGLDAEEPVPCSP